MVNYIRTYVCTYVSSHTAPCALTLRSVYSSLYLVPLSLLRPPAPLALYASCQIANPCPLVKAGVPLYAVSGAPALPSYGEFLRF